MQQIILSKDGHNYVLEKGERTELYPNWLSLLKNLPSILYGFAKVVEGIPKVKGKFEVSPSEEVIRIHCICCGNCFAWPIDAKYYPSLCSERCEFEWGDKNGN